MADLPDEFCQACFWSNEHDFPTQFAIVTAFNPYGVTTGAAKNRAADERLRQELVAAGFAPFRVTGGARDRSHLEPGWGFADESPQRALDHAREFRQLGIFWVSNGKVALVDAATGEITNEMPWAERFLGPDPRPMPED